MLEDSINKLIRDTVNSILNVTGFAIKSEQKDAPRPIGNYCDVNIVSIISKGWERKLSENNTLDPDITEYSEGIREITISLNFYRDGSLDKASKVHIGLTRQTSIDRFSAAKIGLISRSQIRDIAEPLENGWEDRSQFDIVLNTVATDSDIIRSIEIISIAGEYQERGLVYNFEIEV